MKVTSFKQAHSIKKAGARMGKEGRVSRYCFYLSGEGGVGIDLGHGRVKNEHSTKRRGSLQRWFL